MIGTDSAGLWHLCMRGGQSGKLDGGGIVPTAGRNLPGEDLSFGRFYIRSREGAPNLITSHCLIRHYLG